MKLLHLADLHLGKSVLETSMLPVQREVLTQAADYAVRESRRDPAGRRHL